MRLSGHILFHPQNPSSDLTLNNTINSLIYTHRRYCTAPESSQLLYRLHVQYKYIPLGDTSTSVSEHFPPPRTFSSGNNNVSHPLWNKMKYNPDKILTLMMIHMTFLSHQIAISSLRVPRKLRFLFFYFFNTNDYKRLHWRVTSGFFNLDRIFPSFSRLTDEYWQHFFIFINCSTIEQECFGHTLRNRVAMY